MGAGTLEMVGPALYSYCECALILIINTNDGSLETKTASPGATLHFVFRLWKTGARTHLQVSAILSDNTAVV